MVNKIVRPFCVRINYFFPNVLVIEFNFPLNEGDR